MIFEKKHESLAHESIAVRAQMRYPNKMLSEELITKNVSPEEKLKLTKEFNECISSLQLDNYDVTLGALKKCAHLAHFDIKIDHIFLENILNLSISAGRENEISNEANKLAAFSLLTRPNLGIEIIDSAAIAHFIQFLAQPMNHSEVDLLANFLSCSVETFDSSIGKFNFLNIILGLMNSSISVDHFLALLHIIVEVVSKLNPDYINDNDISVMIFNSLIPKFIYDTNDVVFGRIVHLYKLILEDCLKNHIFEFFCMNGFDDYLFQRLVNCRQMDKENIFNLFVNATTCSDFYTRAIYGRNLVSKFQQLAPNINEPCKIIMLKTLNNCFSLGLQVVIEIAQSGFADMALDLFRNGSFNAKLSAISFFCGFCQFSENESIQAYLIQQNIICELVDFLSLPKTIIWNIIIDALYKNAQVAFRTVAEENLFTHPLFATIDVNALYQSLCTINDAAYLKDSQYKGLQSNVIYFLELIEPLIDF